jgi:hypothetical protein
MSPSGALSHTAAVPRQTAADSNLRDCDSAQKIVHLRRRDDDAGSGLLNSRADCRIECREPNFNHGGRRDARCCGPGFRPRQTADVRRATLSHLINGNAALSAEMALRIEKAFGLKVETLLNMQAWHDAYGMRRREGEIAVKPYRPPAPEQQ